MRASSGGVYQPTTTDLGDPSPKWGGHRFLGPGGTTTGTGRWGTKSPLLVLAVLLGLMGLTMVVVGCRWQAAVAAAGNSTVAGVDPPASQPPSFVPYLTVLLLGVLFLVGGVGGGLLYCRARGSSCPCCPSKMAHIRQRLNPHSQLSGPMSAQYSAPPPASPPASPPLDPAAAPLQEAPFADEQQRLMSEESDRCAEEDPRILLSPLRTPDC